MSVLSAEAQAVKREYARMWRMKNRQRINDYAKQWREAHPEAVREHQARHWEKKASLLENEEGQQHAE